MHSPAKPVESGKAASPDTDPDLRLPLDTRVVVLTISDRCARGEQVDRSGPAAV